MSTPNLLDVTEMPGFDAMDTYCPACGEPIDYCRGHSEAVDPEGLVRIRSHDADDHDACSPLADCQLERMRSYVDDLHACDSNTCDICAAARLGFVRIAASLLSSAGVWYESGNGVMPNMNPPHDWPESEAWSAIAGTRPECLACDGIIFVPINEGLHQCDNCLETVEIDMVDIERGRIWAGDWHPGQMSGAYAFTSSGTVTPDGIRYFRDLVRPTLDSAEDPQAEFEGRAVLYSMGAVLDKYLDWT